MNALDPLTPALADLRTHGDALLGSPIVSPPYLPATLTLNKLKRLTEGSVSPADLEAARATVAQFVALVPCGESIRALSPSGHASLLAYADSLKLVADLLHGRAAVHAPAVRAPAGPVSRDTRKPPLPETLRGCSLDKMGYVNRQNVHARCLENGFIKVEKNPWHERLAHALHLDGERTTYVHPDGCWVTVVSDRSKVELGWKGYGLGDLGVLFMSEWY
jgi:hypothetical protein